MADGEEAELQAKLDKADTYDERAKYRKALRELRKNKKDGQHQASTQSRRGSAVYKRFTGTGPTASGSTFVGVKPLTATQPQQRGHTPDKHGAKQSEHTREGSEKIKSGKENRLVQDPTPDVSSRRTASVVEGEDKQNGEQLIEESTSPPPGANDQASRHVEKVSSPKEQTTSPTEQTTSPTEQTTSPTEQMTSPTEQTTSPTEQTTSPTKQTSPTEQTTSPTEQTTSPTKQTSPTEQMTSPTEQMTSRSEQITSPTEQTTEHTTSLTKQTTSPTEKKRSFRGAEDVDFRHRTKTSSTPRSSEQKEDFQKIKLKKTNTDASAKPKSPVGQSSEQMPEFKNFQLRKMESSRPRATTWTGVRPGAVRSTQSTAPRETTPKASLRATSSSTRTPPASSSTRTPPASSYTRTPPTSSSTRSPVEIPKDASPAEVSPATMERYLEQFVSRVLKYPSGGRSLSDLCKDPKALCEIINLCVRGTVDMRALTVVKSGGRREEAVAREENMTLAVESARAIGCQISDNTHSKLLAGDKNASVQILFDLVKAKAVNLPGMKDAPAGIFQNPSLIFAVFGIGDSLHEGVDSSQSRPPKKEVQTTRTPPPMRTTPPDTGTTPPATRTQSESVDKKEPPLKSGESSVVANKDLEELSYEERAARRKAARERRKQERAALASKP